MLNVKTVKRMCCIERIRRDLRLSVHIYLFSYKLAETHGKICIIKLTWIESIFHFTALPETECDKTGTLLRQTWQLKLFLWSGFPSLKSSVMLDPTCFTSRALRFRWSLISRWPTSILVFPCFLAAVTNHCLCSEREKSAVSKALVISSSTSTCKYLSS